MIEGEEIFESAQETGYRLCRSHNNSNNAPESVFSASWDLNFPNRLLVCLQNGELKVYNTENKTSDKFKILFRRYTPIFENDASIEKPVTFHWDKMTTIPDRPDEIIFLLGVSRTLMYTALPPPEDKPYPDQPLIASTARGDLPGFIFGSPVMEITAHKSRITSMAVSPAGHILASGDETGTVRLLLLRLLDEISVFKQNERRRKKHTAATSFSKFLPTYNITQETHNGPIFSLQWLPIISSTDMSNTRNYALATGSVDRSVRIWRVTCSSRTGISMVPTMMLDTLTTHVLSLSSYLYTDPYVLAKLHRFGSLSNASTPVKESSQAGQRFSFSAESRGEVSNNAAQSLNSAKSIFLAAGTSVGMVYVWKLDYMEILGCLDTPAAAAPSGALPPHKVVVDDGTKLHSLLQASDRPIINLSLTAYPYSGLLISPVGSNGRRGLQALATPTSSGADVVLAASDTVGCVHIFTPEKMKATGSNDTPTISPVSATTDMKTPLVRVGEKTYPAPVVSCSFPPAYPCDPESPTPGSPTNRSVAGSVVAALSNKLDRWDPTAMSQRSGPLLIGIANGELSLYSTDDLSALSYEGQQSIADRENDTKLKLPRRKGHSLMPDEDSIDSHDSLVEETERKHIRQVSMQKQRSLSLASDRTSTIAVLDESDDNISDGPEEWERQNASTTVRKTVRLLPTPSAPSPHLTKQQTSSRTQAQRGAQPSSSSSQLRSSLQEEDSECPRTAPPPAPFRSEKSTDNIPQIQRNAIQIPGPTAVSRVNNSNGNTRPGSLKHARSSSPELDIENWDVRTDTTSTPSSPTLPSPPAHVQRLMQRQKDKTATPSAGLYNMFTKPVETYSKVLEAEVKGLAEKIDRDEMSVSTLQTTRSDKLAAARAAQASAISARNARYGALTPSQGLDNVDMDYLLRDAQMGRFQKRIAKQVDPEWLSRRKYGGPSEEDLDPLGIPDPLVGLSLSYVPSIPILPNKNNRLTAVDSRNEINKTRQDFLYNSEFGLKHELDETTLTPKYHMEVNMEQVFGGFHATKALQEGETGRRNYEQTNMLSLITNFQVL